MLISSTVLCAPLISNNRNICSALFSNSTSDGYIDQFGGTSEEIRGAGGKKFKIKAFQCLLLENAHLTAAEHREILEKTLNEWRGNIKQVDDITVIGFRV